MSEDVRNKALLYGLECTNGYIELLEHVLMVMGCMCGGVVCVGWAGGGVWEGWGYVLTLE